jgi:hypothetical protein
MIPIIIPIPSDHRAAAHGFSSGIDLFERRFGRLWLTAWVTCGVLGLAGIALAVWAFMPSMIDIDLPIVLWVLLGCWAMLVVAHGPAAVAAALFIGSVLGVFSWLMG